MELNQRAAPRWKLIIGLPGISYPNIMFHATWRMKGGKFPKEHPCSGNPKPTIFDAEPATDDPLGRFRAKHPDASCFPEGDGISFTVTPANKPASNILRDIEEAFGVACALHADYREKGAS